MSREDGRHVTFHTVDPPPTIYGIFSAHASAGAWSDQQWPLESDETNRTTRLNQLPSPSEAEPITALANVDLWP